MLSPGHFLGVQRAKPFAGVRGVPEKLLLSFLPPKAASQKGRQEDIYPAQEKSVGDKGVNAGWDACVALACFNDVEL